MQLKTILNQVTDYKSFVFDRISSRVTEESQCVLDVQIRPRSNGLVVCSGCGQVAPLYDQAAQARRFEFVPLWGILVFFVYRMRRVNCSRCGVRREKSHDLGVPVVFGAVG